GRDPGALVGPTHPSPSALRLACSHAGSIWRREVRWAKNCTPAWRGSTGGSGGADGFDDQACRGRPADGFWWKPPGRTLARITGTQYLTLPFAGDNRCAKPIRYCVPLTPSI